MATYSYHWFISLLGLLDRKQLDRPVARVRNPAGASSNEILCPSCGYQGQAMVLPNSIEYSPTGWRQFDIGFLVARIVTLIWCLIGLVGFLALNILNIAAPASAPKVLLFCYVVALVVSVAYAVRYMTPFDNCRLLKIVSAPAIDVERNLDLPYLATAEVTCGQCEKHFPSVTIIENIPKTADPFR
jgi:hypothetical protein